MSATIDAPGSAPAPMQDTPAGAALREGWPLIAGAAALAVPLGLLDRRLAAPPLLLAGAIAAFFRDPRRTTPPDDTTIYRSAADGYILDVDEVDEPWFLGGRALRIITFLSIFDVHVNRSPVAGTLRRTEHIDGGYAAAMLREASENNERQLLAIDGVHAARSSSCRSPG